MSRRSSKINPHSVLLFPSVALSTYSLLLLPLVIHATDHLYLQGLTLSLLRTKWLYGHGRAYVSSQHLRDVQDDVEFKACPVCSARSYPDSNNNKIQQTNPKPKQSLPGRTSVCPPPPQLPCDFLIRLVWLPILEDPVSPVHTWVARMWHHARVSAGDLTPL